MEAIDVSGLRNVEFRFCSSFPFLVARVRVVVGEVDVEVICDSRRYLYSEGGEMR